jgi:hypothetical protein
VREGLTDVARHDIEACVRRAMWTPDYPAYAAG